MDSVPSSGNIAAGGDIHAENVITGIQQQFTIIFHQPFTPPPDLVQLRTDYLTYLRDSYRYLDMQGIQQVQQVTQQLALTDVYVPLKADAGHAAAAGRVAGRPWSREGAAIPDTIAAAALAHHAEPVPVEVALHTAPAVVVLGDPGSGKSTLLKVLALALAAQPDGPLPILLPLNAYARRLMQQGELSLSQFLGDYYASRQHKLERVGELFHQALTDHQAVILLDGLDEVQVNRAHLVRLVQDFVAEYIPPPADPPEPAAVSDRPPPVVAGNRVVATSRIVGYDEAPLAGRQWRTYTLTDFTRADIEQFVTQWTLAFTRSIQGDTEPARQAAAQERRDLLQAIFHNPSVERLAANPLLLTILALIKHTGVTLPEQRVKLYELYLQTLIESWNLARSLDQYPVGESMQYEETVQVLAPLALWLRQENPTAGLVTQDQLEQWLTDYYRGEEWRLPTRRGASAGAGLSRQRATVLEPAPGAGRAPVRLLAPDPGRNAGRPGHCPAHGCVTRGRPRRSSSAICSTPPGRKHCNWPLASLGSSNGAPELPERYCKSYWQVRCLRTRPTEGAAPSLPVQPCWIYRATGAAGHICRPGPGAEPLRCQRRVVAGDPCHRERVVGVRRRPPRPGTPPDRRPARGPGVAVVAECHGVLLEAGLAPGLANLLTSGVGNGTNFIATAPAGTYYTRLRAVNACGVSGPSVEVPVALGCTAESVVPGGLTVTKSGGAAVFSWLPPLGALSYRLRLGSAPGVTDLGEVEVGAVTSLGVSLAGVPPGTYYVRVAAVSACGVGTASNEVAVSVP